MPHYAYILACTVIKNKGVKLLLFSGLYDLREVIIAIEHNPEIQCH